MLPKTINEFCFIGYVHIFIFDFLFDRDRNKFFGVFPKTLKISFKFTSKLFYYEMVVVCRPIMKNYWNILGILYLKLHVLCAAPLYLPVKWQ